MPGSSWTRSLPTCAALIAGERDPEVLADLARGRLRLKIPALRQALRGRFTAHHALIGLALDHTTHVWPLEVLTQCAWSAARTRDTYLAAQFWRLARRIEKRAPIAVAHSILVICCHPLTNDCDYNDLGGDYFTRRNTDRQRDRLINQLHNLGYRVTLDRPA